jgi:glycosyltransferase involved in cell wall biosynthesis
MQDSLPFFSIILPTYNRAKFLRRAIESVLSQTYDNWEFIIVDDGSTDNSKEIIDSYIDSRVRYIYQQNSERSTARNKGIDSSKGKYICFLDSDDYYMPDCLSVFSHRIKETKEPCAMFVSGIYEESEMGKQEKKLFDPKYIDHPLIYYWENTVLTPISVCIHNEILKENKFIPEFNIWEDTHLWIRILAQYAFYYVDAYIAVNVKHEESGVVKDMAVVKIEKVKKYIAAINHLFANYPFILQHLNIAMKRKYIDKKYKMFIYQSRVNGQFEITLKLIFNALWNKLSFGNVLLLIKLPFNYLKKGN